jgi:hypothetical protein
MTAVPQTHIWDDSVPVESQLRTMLTFLAGALGLALVSVLLWAVLHVVTRA